MTRSKTAATGLRLLKSTGGVLAAYLLLTILMTWPTVLHLTDGIPGDGFDGWQNYWNLWWVKEALLVLGTSPYFTDYLYPPIGTNLLFFEKGEPTREVWFYEHRVPDGQKAYSMTKPIKVEHFQGCVDWWGGPERQGRQVTEQAWQVGIEAIKARGYNLDFKNPHTVAADHGEPEELLAQLDAAEAQTAMLRKQLKGILTEALLR